MNLLRIAVLGFGVSIEDESLLKFSNNIYPFIISGVGAEYMLEDKIGIKLYAYQSIHS